MNGFFSWSKHARIQLEDAKQKHQQQQGRVAVRTDPDALVDMHVKQLLQSMIAPNAHVVVYTGAGISTAANIPDYRLVHPSPFPHLPATTTAKTLQKRVHTHKYTYTYTRTHARARTNTHEDTSHSLSSLLPPTQQRSCWAVDTSGSWRERGSDIRDAAGPCCVPADVRTHAAGASGVPWCCRFCRIAEL